MNTSTTPRLLPGLLTAVAAVLLSACQSVPLYPTVQPVQPPAPTPPITAPAPEREQAQAYAMGTPVGGLANPLAQPVLMFWSIPR